MDIRNTFIRHPREFPLLLRKHSPASPANSQRVNHNRSNPSSAGRSSCQRQTAYGGIRCHWHEQLTPGHRLQLCIPSLKPEFWGQARVSWCQPEEDGFDVGLELLDAEEAFRFRMLEQLCHIRSYRDQIKTDEGRQLDSEQAAHEWISKFAAQFPTPSF